VLDLGIYSSDIVLNMDAEENNLYSFKKYMFLLMYHFYELVMKKQPT